MVTLKYSIGLQQTFYKRNFSHFNLTYFEIKKHGPQTKINENMSPSYSKLNLINLNKSNIKERKINYFVAYNTHNNNRINYSNFS